MERVLLVSSNRERFPEPVFPLGAVYVAGALYREGIEVRIFDSGVYPFHERSMARLVESFRPTIVGVSLRNVDNASYPKTRCYLPHYRRQIQVLREVTDVPIVAGGSASSIFPKEICEYLDLDGVFTGDGESVAPFILSGKAQGIHRCRLSDLDAVEFPRAIRKIFPEFSRYRVIGVQTVRGCSHRCVYCTYPLLEGREVRKRDPKKVAEEMEYLARDHGKRDFFIVDSTFNADEEHAEQVLEAITKLPIGVRFSCYLEPKVSSPTFIRLLKKAGCVGVDFGTDSGSPEIISSLRKGFSREDIEKVSSWCREVGLDFCHSLLFGGPGENERTIQETVDLMDRVKPCAVIAMTGIRVYPGTEMEEIARGAGTIREEESLLDPVFFFGGLSPESLVMAVRMRIEGKKNWFFPGEKDWARAIGPKILRLFHRIGPLWRALRS